LCGNLLNYNMNTLRSTFVFSILFILTSTAFAGENNDKLESPALFQGKIIMHFPIGALPRDSTGTSFFWMPIPEMGFNFCPTIPFDEGDGWWEFPMHVMAFFPFLEKWGALGDISIGAGFQAPPLYRMGIAYRFMSGRFYPLEASFYTHIAEVDISLPIRGFSGAGAKFDWIITCNLDMNKPYTSDGKAYDHYEGTLFTIAPYWKFDIKYGIITLAYRLVVSSKLTGTDIGKNTSYEMKTKSVSAIEVDYTYP